MKMGLTCTTHWDSCLSKLLLDALKQQGAQTTGLF